MMCYSCVIMGNWEVHFAIIELSWTDLMPTSLFQSEVDHAIGSTQSETSCLCYLACLIIRLQHRLIEFQYTGIF